MRTALLLIAVLGFVAVNSQYQILTCDDYYQYQSTWTDEIECLNHFIYETGDCAFVLDHGGEVISFLVILF